MGYAKKEKKTSIDLDIKFFGLSCQNPEFLNLTCCNHLKRQINIFDTGRGVGKSFTVGLYFLKNFLKYGYKFCIIERYTADFKREYFKDLTQLLSKMNGKEISIKIKGLNNDVILQIDDTQTQIGKIVSLNAYQKIKSSDDFSAFRYILFDEFQVPGNVRPIYDSNGIECELAIIYQILETIVRTPEQHVRIFLLSNKINRYNHIYAALKLKIPKEKLGVRIVTPNIYFDNRLSYKYLVKRLTGNMRLNYLKEDTPTEEIVGQPIEKLIKLVKEDNDVLYTLGINYLKDFDNRLDLKKPRQSLSVISYNGIKILISREHDKYYLEYAGDYEEREDYKLLSSNLLYMRNIVSTALRFVYFAKKYNRLIVIDNICNDFFLAI